MQRRYQDVLLNIKEDVTFAVGKELDETLQLVADRTLKRAALFAAHRLQLPKGSTKSVEITVEDVENALASLEVE